MVHREIGKSGKRLLNACYHDKLRLKHNILGYLKDKLNFSAEFSKT